MSASDLLRKSYTAIKNEGIKGFINKSIHYLAKGDTIFPVCVTKDSKELTVSFMLSRHFRNLQRIPYLPINSEELRINMVTDSLEKDSLFGGVATALIITTIWAQFRKCKLRIITRTAPVNAMAYKRIMKINEIINLPEVEFYSDYDRDIDGKKNNALEVGQSEIFVATSWWSAFAIRKTFPSMKIAYILQEVETFFYPHGDEHSLCQSIMQDKNIVYIVNTKLLFDYFQVHDKNIFLNGISFEPAFTRSLYQMRTKQDDKKKQRLFFYARPNNPRNLFYRGIDFINKGINSGIIDTDKWEIVCLGINVPDVVFDNGYKMINKGILDLDKYGEFLSNVDLALSLMYTPHPSYPPYDVLCSGGVVLTNQCENKKEFQFSKNAILFDLNSNDSFLTNLEKAIALAENVEKRVNNLQQSNISRSWYESLKSTITFLEKQYEW